MAQIIDSKCQNFVQRYSGAVVQLMNTLQALTSLKAEWDANGYATGAAAVGGTTWNITDAQVQTVLPAATAAMLNSAVGAVASIETTYNSNVGYLTVLRP